MYLNFRNRICEYLNINVFKHEESDKASVDSTHTQGGCGGESIDSPAVSVSHFSTIDTEYIFVSSNTIMIFKITLINDYLISNQEINQTSVSFVMLDLLVNFMVSCNFYNFN